MAGSVNRVILVGNVGRDPEIRSTQDGRKIASFSVATSESWKEQTSGERKKRTFWHQVVVFNAPLAETVEKYIRKGSKVFVSGAMQTRKYTDRSGAERYVTEVVLAAFRGELQLLDRAESNRPPPADDQDAYGSTGPAYGHDGPEAARQRALDDQIPF